MVSTVVGLQGTPGDKGVDSNINKENGKGRSGEAGIKELRYMKRAVGWSPDSVILLKGRSRKGGRRSEEVYEGGADRFSFEDALQKDGGV